MHRKFINNAITSLPIRKKLAILSIAPIAMLCISAFVYIPKTIEHQLCSAIQDKTHSIAKIASYSCRTALVFQDKEAIEEVLHSIGQDSNLTCVYVNDEHGEKVAEFERTKNVSDEHYNDVVQSGISADGQIYQTVEPIQIGSKGIGNVVVCLSMSEMHAEVSSMKSFIALITVAVFLISTIILIVISSIITNPLRHLVHVVQLLSEGSLHNRATYKGNDEVGLLSHSVNIMAENLERAYTQLEEANQTLEDRVLQRTTELQDEIKVRIKTEEQLLLSKELAESANKAKTAFLSSMSHELRTPLNSIIGFSQILKNNVSISGQTREFINTMHRSGLHLPSMINDILDISKIEAGEMSLIYEPCTIDDVLGDLSSMFSTTASEKNLQYTVNRDTTVPDNIIADTKRLRQVLINMIGNAIKFTKAGQVSLSINSLAVDATTNTVILRFAVKDTGRGIDPKQLAEIFKPFRQHDNLYSEGTGLGLAICKKIIEKMDGHIGVHSQVGVGSEFWFEIPCSIAQTENAGTHPLESSSSRVIGIISEKTPLVLIIDDVADNRTVLRSLIEPLGLQCIEAINGEDSIAKFGEHNPDIVFLDIMMPVMTGLEVIHYFRNTIFNRSVPVIAITASVFEYTKTELLNKGFNDYIGKPFMASQIYGILEQYCSVTLIRDNKEQEVAQELTSKDMAQWILALPPEIAQDISHAIEVQDFEEVKTLLQYVTPETETNLQMIVQLTQLADCANYKMAIDISQYLTSQMPEWQV